MIFIPVPKEFFDSIARKDEDELIINGLISLSHGYAHPLHKIFVDEQVDENGNYQCAITTPRRSECLVAEITKIVISCEHDCTEIKLKNIRRTSKDFIDTQYYRDAQYYRQRQCSNCDGHAGYGHGDWCRGIGNCERIMKKQERLLAIDGETRAKAGLCENLSYWGYKVGDIIRRKGEEGASMITAIRGNTHEGCVFAFGEWIKDLTQYEIVKSEPWEYFG